MPSSTSMRKTGKAGGLKERPLPGGGGMSGFCRHKSTDSTASVCMASSRPALMARTSVSRTCEAHGSRGYWWNCRYARSSRSTFPRLFRSSTTAYLHMTGASGMPCSATAKNAGMKVLRRMSAGMGFGSTPAGAGGWKSCTANPEKDCSCRTTPFK